MIFKILTHWKTQLTIAINFILPNYVEEECEMHSKTGNIKFTSYNDANKVVDKFFESLFSRCQDNLEISVRGSDFISVQMMH